MATHQNSTVISRVPQGSVLGPLVFLVMIGDIDNTTQNVLLSSFADDSRLMKQIIKLLDITLMQEDLNRVYLWSDRSNSQLNGEKFECLRYGKNADIKDETYYLTPEGAPIPCKTQVKDLDVIMANDCSFKIHIENNVESPK